MKAKALANVYGGKSRFASVYSGYIHELTMKGNADTFIDLFGGGASISIMVSRLGIFNNIVFNDLNIGMYALAKTVADYDRCERLVNRILETEYSEDTFRKAVDVLTIIKAPDIATQLNNGGIIRMDIEKIRDGLDLFDIHKRIAPKKSIEDIAYYQWLASNMSYSGICKTFKRDNDLSTTDLQHTMWNKAESLLELTADFEGITIENMSFEDIFEKYKNANAVWFADPPYLKATRTAKDDTYEWEMTWVDHLLLINHLMTKERFILCGYDVDKLPDSLPKMIYGRLTSAACIQKIDLEIISRGSANRKQTEDDPHETIWMKGEIL